MKRALALALLLMCIAVAVHAGTVTLAWDASSGATGYKVYYGLAPGNYTQAVDAQTATSITVPSLTAGQTYYFAATAYDSARESGYSNEVSQLIAAPSTTLAVNAGGPQFKAGDGTAYSADQWFTGGGTYSTTANIAGTTDDTLYQSERWGNFTYAIPVQNGPYLVTLKFAEIYLTQSNQRIFDVLIEGQEVISNLDIYAQVGANAAYDRSFSVQVCDGVLTIQFRTDLAEAKVSAIKVVPQ